MMCGDFYRFGVRVIGTIVPASAVQQIRVVNLDSKLMLLNQCNSTFITRPRPDLGSILIPRPKKNSRPMEKQARFS